MTSDFPFRSFDRLWHVGTLVSSNKRTNSYEGAGLSVSRHPEEWIHIAKLGGNATWELTKPGNKFLDAHALSRKQKHAIMAWGIANGFAEACDLWRWRRYDDELEQHIVSTFTTRAEAMTESEGCDGTVRKVEGHVSTSSLDAVTLQTSQTAGTACVLDLLYPIYANDVLRLDGVWWADLLDPTAYSAPRGVIGTSCLSTWTVELVDIGLIAA